MTSSGLNISKTKELISCISYKDRIGLMYDNIIHLYFISTACASVASTDVLRFTHNTSYPDRIIASFKGLPAENLLTLCRGCLAFPFPSQKKQTVLSNETFGNG